MRKLDDSAEFMHLAIFPSGYLYMKARGRQVRLLPWEIIHSKASEGEYPQAELDDLGRYHSVIGVRHGDGYKSVLRRRAARYIDELSKIISSYRPDVVVLSGDTRLPCEALKYCLGRAESKPECYYFEQGPNSTTILDVKGVNANCSFRDELAFLTGEGYSSVSRKKQKHYSRNPIYRGFDHLLISLLRLIGNVPPEWDTLSLHKYPKSKYFACLKSNGSMESKSREVLIALQVPDDANNVHHNPLNLSDVTLLQMVLKATENMDINIRVREHPLFRRKYSYKLYQAIESSERTSLSNLSLDEDLTRCAVVVTVNSMTGLDAYLKNIPVVVLGNSFYDALPGIGRASDENSLQEQISRCSGVGTAENMDPSAIFGEMSAKYLIPGHYRDDVLSAATKVAEILTNRPQRIFAKN
ncbi:hypothetical protein [Variovorax paradoxus]|uniref:capsular polysaccharide export protein, LipB/KpsS family n=1 Tax=Variovorax paradoxus TaxID=34073 RepID=UPI0018B0BFB8|nr:hypothetical protein [Variovorax paradoxus]